MSARGYILGVDGGGSKTVCRLIDIASQQQWQAQGGPSSLTNDMDGAMANIQALWRNVINQADVDSPQITAVMGLAGAGSPSRAESLRQRLALSLSFQQLYICNDAQTSMIGANMGEPVAMVALGTGSVGARLDHQQQVSYFGGWGFVAGDEGGGAKLGLHAVQHLLSALDSQQSSLSKLGRMLASQIGESRETLLTWLSQARAQDFAPLSKSVFSLAEQCPVADQLIRNHAAQVDELIAQTMAAGPLPLVLLGGLAEPTRAYLSPSSQQHIVPPKGTSLDGACLMAKRLNKVSNNSGITTYAE